jgi:hypothetical protein
METQINPNQYKDYMILYTAGDVVNAVVDGSPVGPTGRLFTVNPNVPAKVPYEAGRFILDHLAYTGVVRVNESLKEDGSGTKYDIDTAKEESLEKFKESDERRWRDYVTYCIDDKVNQKRAVPSTPDSIRAIMERRGYRLSDYGINPVGEIQPVDAKNVELMKLVGEQSKQIAALTARLDDALGEPSKKGK